MPKAGSLTISGFAEDSALLRGVYQNLIGYIRHHVFEQKPNYMTKL